jgi:hypothetical protein
LLYFYNHVWLGISIDFAGSIHHRLAADFQGRLMNNDTKFYYMGYEHGINDQCNKRTNLVANINSMPNHPCKRVYPPKYLEGYAAAYEEAKDKFWYIVAVANSKINSYYAEGSWVGDKEQATKYTTRAALELVIKRLPGYRAGKCGMKFE